MRSYRRSVDLPVSAEDAFAWHTRPGALERLVPPWERVVVESPAPVADGARAVLAVGVGPFRQRWVAEHRDVTPGVGFEDVQVDGPFRAWRHRHRFEPLEGGARCRLVDELELELPGGRLAGWAWPSVRRRLDRTFAYRHRVVAADLELMRRFSERPRLTVAMTGSSGLVGRALTGVLGTAGHRVVRLVRREPRSADEASWYPDRGLADPAALAGVDAIVHLAGENIGAGRWTSARRRRIVSSRVEGTANLVASLVTVDPPVSTLVTASAVGVYGDRGAERLDETSSPGEGFLADLGQAWEAAAAGAAAVGTRVVSCRLGIVLSPRGGVLQRMLPPFRLGLGGPLGSGRQYVSWVGIDDVVGVLVHALHRPDLAGPVNTVAPEPVPFRELAATLGRVLRRPAMLPVPAPLLRLLFGEMADEAILASTRVLPARLEEAGYEFRHPDLEGALRHLLGRET